MAKKARRRSVLEASPVDLLPRIKRAALENRHQQALELAKQLYKSEPINSHKEVLLKSYLDRARQLRGQGKQDDVFALLHAAVQVAADDPKWLPLLAEELAACGEAAQALSLLRAFPDSPSVPRVLGKAADAALERSAAGRALLPEELRADFDRIATAFTQSEAGQDEAARETLQGIGLRSPFLDWKLLLRGLIAYYARDDVRAIENWQRLDSERLPARLAAPLRFQIDEAFRISQAPKTQVTLQKLGDRLQGQSLVTMLRDLQQALGREGQLHRAFRQAEQILPALRQQMPELAARLEGCFFWAVVQNGEPEDIPRYQRLFGTKAGDSNCSRMRALLYEHLGELQSAQTEWRNFEKQVAGNPTVWPGDQSRSVRALIWYHMGCLADQALESNDEDFLPPFTRSHPGRPKAVVPGPEECLTRAIELAPDQLAPHEALLDYYQAQKEADKAQQTAQCLLRHFPDHVPTLTALGDLLIEQKKYADALKQFQHARRVNPLDGDLRTKVWFAHQLKGWEHTERGELELARAEYQSSLANDLSGTQKSTTYCKWAACEFKAHNAAAAEELLRQAAASVGSRLAVAFRMLVEVIRLKLDRKLKTRFDREFAATLAEPPSVVGALANLELCISRRLTGEKYTGQKAHEKKVLTYLDVIPGELYTESELCRVCELLLVWGEKKQFKKYIALGKRRFPASPHFYLFEAESWLEAQKRRSVPWQAAEALRQARKLAEKLPPENRERKKSLDRISTLEKELVPMSPIMHLFDGPFGAFADSAFEEEDEPDEDEWF